VLWRVAGGSSKLMGGLDRRLHDLVAFLRAKGLAAALLLFPTSDASINGLRFPVTGTTATRPAPPPPSVGAACDDTAACCLPMVPAAAACASYWSCCSCRLFSAAQAVAAAASCTPGTCSAPSRQLQPNGGKQHGSIGLAAMNDSKLQNRLHANSNRIGNSIPVADVPTAHAMHMPLHFIVHVLFYMHFAPHLLPAAPQVRRSS